MMEDFERIEELLRNKAPEELTLEERQMLAQFTDDELRTYHQAIADVRVERRALDPSLKGDLMRELKRSRAPRGVLFTTKVPAYTNAVAAIAAFVVSWWVFDRPAEVEQVERIVEVVRTDTVEVARTDTVFLDRFIEVEKTIYVAQEAVPEESEVNPTQPRNKALSDSQELMDLIIRSD
ncbi:MAG: hypothetical protein AAGA85_27990 [Bacteroidota bacterium]